MKRVIIVHGLIAGTIVSGMLLVSQPLIESGTLNFDNGMVVGYASMVVALSMVFFGIKAYRDQHQKGAITFGQAFGVGILITLLASLLYASTWEVYYNIAGSDFMNQYTQYYLEKLEQEGASAGELNTARLEMEKSNEYYKNPVIRFGITLLEILPVGIVITLISSAILKKREILAS
jgi:hypothetical protein